MNTCNQQVANRLKRAEGQIRGIQKMIDAEKSCSDIIMQLSAVRSSIDSVMGMIVAENLKHCLEEPVEEPAEQAKLVEQAIKLIVKK